MRWLAALALMAAPALAQDCGREVACEVAGGSYNVALPDAPNGRALMFLHGFGGTGAGTLRNTGLVNAALDRGWTVVAPSSQDRDGRRAWNFRPGGDGRDEAAFLIAVRDDAAARFGLDPARTSLGGFSIGGSMAAYVACSDPQAFDAYLPVGGNFWRPHPTACAGPVRMLHTHGWMDGTVPLEGRVFRVGAARQGDVFAALEIWRQTNGCNLQAPDEKSWGAPFAMRIWTSCTDGSALQFALFGGGHEVPQGWAAMALPWVEALPDR